MWWKWPRQLPSRLPLLKQTHQRATACVLPPMAQWLHRLRTTMKSRKGTNPLLWRWPDKNQCQELDSVHDFFITPAEVLKLISTSSNKSFSMEFIPTSLIKSCTAVFSEIISNLANLSISQGSFQLKFKLAQVTSLLKKPGLDKNTPSNYCPISNFNKISILLERPILSFIKHHTTFSSNFNRFQSAYTCHYSTVTGPRQYLPCYWQGLIDGADIIES